MVGIGMQLSLFLSGETKAANELRDRQKYDARGIEREKEGNEEKRREKEFDAVHEASRESDERRKKLICNPRRHKGRHLCLSSPGLFLAPRSLYCDCRTCLRGDTQEGEGEVIGFR